VIGGLIVSTLVTLLIVPVFLEIFGDLERRRAREEAGSGRP
jgi:Cu/Ag efflux pump CusA